MHKELRKQEKGLVAVAASLKQISTEQMARILHMENSTASTKEQVLVQGKMQEHIGKETKILQDQVTILHANVDKLRHEQDKITDNERAGKEIHDQQMLALKEEVAHLREAHIAQDRATTAMQIRFRNEQEKLRNNEKSHTDTFRRDFERSLNELRANLANLQSELESSEKLRNNERSQTATFQRDFERSFHELRAKLGSLHTELTSSKIGEREECTKLEEQLCAVTATLKTTCKERMEELRQEIEQTIEAESGGNTAFEQSMETKLEASAAELHGLREEFQQFKDSQSNDRANQQSRHFLGQTVEKLGHLVEKQTEFLGKMLPKLLGQQEAKEDTKRERDFTPSTKDPCKTQGVLPNLREVDAAAINLLPKLLGQEEAKEDTKRERDFTPSTKDPCKAQGVLPNLREVDTAAAKDISVDHSVSRNPKQNAFSDVSDAKAVMIGLNEKTEAQVTIKKNTITPRLFYVRDDSDRRIGLIDMIRSVVSDKGNTIIYVNDEQRRNHLAEFLLDFRGEFSERILLTTTQDMGSITGMDNKHEDLSLWKKILK